MTVIIPYEPSFDVPEGRYRAVLTKVIELKHKDQVRLIFDLMVPGKRYVAGKNYNISLENGTPLRHDLISWRGRDFTEEEIKNAQFDLNSMLGQQADLLLTHTRKDGYKKPFVGIAKILPPGTLLPGSSDPILQPAF
jgi:hypothetical protein